MSFRSTEWPELLKTKPDEARARLTAALQASGGRADGAAASLGLTTRTLLRYRKTLSIGETVHRGRPKHVRDSIRVD